MASESGGDHHLCRPSPAPGEALDRWPTALALVQVAAALLVIIGDQNTDFAAGIAAMACIYMVAYAVGSKVAAWPAFPAVIATLVVLEAAGVDSLVAMPVLLLVLWAVAIAGLPDGRWFAIQRRAWSSSAG